MEKIDISEIKETMKSYYLIKKIYEIHNEHREKEDNPIEYKLITVNPNVLDYIRDVNFIFVGDVGIIDQIKKYRKVGNLLNLQVFLDPFQTENKVIFHNEQRDQIYELNVII